MAPPWAVSRALTSFIWPGPLSHILRLFPQWHLFLLSLSLWDLSLSSRQPTRPHQIFPSHRIHPLPHHHSLVVPPWHLQGRDQVHLSGTSLLEIALLDTLLTPWVNRTSFYSNSFVSKTVWRTTRKHFLFIVVWSGFHKTSKQLVCSSGRNVDAL